MKKKNNDYFKDIKTKKSDVKPLKVARDTLALVGGLVVLDAALDII